MLLMYKQTRKTWYYEKERKDNQRQETFNGKSIQ